MVNKREVLSWIEDNNHIYFYYDEVLDGLFITLLYGNDKKPYKVGKMWIEFLNEYKDYDIFFISTEHDFIKNHIEFFGNFGNRQVYKYVR